MRSGDHPLQILTQNQLFPTARPDFVQQNEDHRARERSYNGDNRIGPNWMRRFSSARHRAYSIFRSDTTSMKRTELQSTRQTSPRAVNTRKFASAGAATPYAWKLVALLSLGGCFEIYNLALTATLSPGLIRSGIFHEDLRGLWALTDQATFAAATFAGLFIGSAALGAFADKFGSRTIFTVSELWFSVAPRGMGLQQSAVGIDAWRFLTGIGLGLELV